MTLKYLNKLSKSKHFLNYHWIPTNDYYPSFLLNFILENLHSK